MKRCLIILYALIVFFFLFTACGKTDKNVTEREVLQKDKVVIGFAMDTLVHERWLRDRDIFISKAM
jgi:D-xylose transport system substrate-binding protein